MIESTSWQSVHRAYTHGGTHCPTRLRLSGGRMPLARRVPPVLVSIAQMAGRRLAQLLPTGDSRSPFRHYCNAVAYTVVVEVKHNLLGYMIPCLCSLLLSPHFVNKALVLARLCRWRFGQVAERQPTKPPRPTVTGDVCLCFRNVVNRQLLAVERVVGVIKKNLFASFHSITSENILPRLRLAAGLGANYWLRMVSAQSMISSTGAVATQSACSWPSGQSYSNSSRYCSNSGVFSILSWIFPFISVTSLFNFCYSMIILQLLRFVNSLFLDSIGNLETVTLCSRFVLGFCDKLG